MMYTQIHGHRHSHTGAHEHTQRHVYRHTQTQTYRHTDIQTHTTHIDTCTDTYKHTIMGATSFPGGGRASKNTPFPVYKKYKCRKLIQ